ncbi:type ISP restriction/modification enzyme [Tamlana sp. I1]|uniref:type ISP restriction/modification enzyme n=1 Tax=Tamlana sp. I1 TaxID=2762061 RepID=UPI0018908A8E|nr:type ISP restriction/modification enzyme [Tamlana sp. I1]
MTLIQFAKNLIQRHQKDVSNTTSFLIDLQSLSKNLTSENKKPSNLFQEINTEFSKNLDLTFVLENETGNLCYSNNTAELQDNYKQIFTATDLLNYIYAILYSPEYKTQKTKLLKTDAPKFPYPKSANTFWEFVKIEKEISKKHTYNK